MRSSASQSAVGGCAVFTNKLLYWKISGTFCTMMATTATMEDDDAAAAAAAAAASNANTTEDTNNDNNIDWQIQRDAWKQDGDDAFRAGDYAAAIQHYTSGLSLDPEHGTLLSNRSAAYLQRGEKSKALYDAQACVRVGTMGLKGISRLAAALQSLGRYEAALEQWKSILLQETNHAAALKGQDVCEAMLQELKKKQQSTETEKGPEIDNDKDMDKEDHNKDSKDEDDDDLGDFFDDVETAAETVLKEKIMAAQPVATEAILNHKKDLGTAEVQIARILPNDNYVWYNLNPFHVLDLPHTASPEDISRRFKALSLLLHPDKNQSFGDPDRVQLAYDQVLAAKATLYDETKAHHVRQLVEEGMVRGRAEYQQQQQAATVSLEECQRVAVQKLFAELEHTRRQVAKRERAFHQREQQQEDDVADKARKERQFDRQWRDEERVDKRIGNWRDFQSHKKKKGDPK